MASLHEFRALQAELAPWTAAFAASHGRKPGVADVEATGIPWLSLKFKQYVLLRERVLSDTQGLRGRLHEVGGGGRRARAQLQFLKNFLRRFSKSNFIFL